MSSRSSSTGRSPTHSAEPSPHAETAVDHANHGAILARRPGAALRGPSPAGTPIPSAPAFPCQLQGEVAGPGSGERRRTVAGPNETPQDISARDDAHLESLGIKPQLNRSLGFLANFALAFSFISVSTGSFGNFGVGFGLGGPVMFWTWLIIVAGQFIVALGFAELASHYPVAGSIYQWSKRLSHRTLGWFTGWFYFWAQVVTVTAVACIVAFVVDGIMGQKDFLA